MNNWVNYLLYLPGIVALLGWLFSLFKLRPELNKLRAEAAHTDAETGETLATTRKLSINGQSTIITNLRMEIERLTVRVEVVETEKKAMGARVTQLETDYTLLRRQYTHVLNWALPKGYEPPPHW